jgi:hypothetical protein
MAHRKESTPAERRASMTWAQRLKRVFNIDIETCNNCGGNVKIVACIEDPEVIEKILIYLERKDTQLLSRVCHRLEGHMKPHAWEAMDRTVNELLGAPGLRT